MAASRVAGKGAEAKRVARAAGVLALLAARWLREQRALAQRALVAAPAEGELEGAARAVASGRAAEEPALAGRAVVAGLVADEELEGAARVAEERAREERAEPAPEKAGRAEAAADA